MALFDCECGNLVTKTPTLAMPADLVVRAKTPEKIQAQAVTILSKFLGSQEDEAENLQLKGIFASIYPEGLSGPDILDYIRELTAKKYSDSTSECGRCGRVWIQTEEDDPQYLSYKPGGAPVFSCSS